MLVGYRQKRSALMNFDLSYLPKCDENVLILKSKQIFSCYYYFQSLVKTSALVINIIARDEIDPNNFTVNLEHLFSI